MGMENTMKNYRVNYGNGQVSENFKYKKDAVKHIEVMDMYREFARIQAYDAHNQVWFTLFKGQL